MPRGSYDSRAVMRRILAGILRGGWSGPPGGAGQAVVDQSKGPLFALAEPTYAGGLWFLSAVRRRPSPRERD